MPAATDPLTGLGLSDADEQMVRDFLTGEKTPASEKGSAALPVGGPAVGGAPSPSVGGSGISSPGALGFKGSVTPGAGAPAKSDIALALKALGLGQDAAKLFDKFFATETPPKGTVTDPQAQQQINAPAGGAATDVGFLSSGAQFPTPGPGLTANVESGSVSASDVFNPASMNAPGATTGESIVGTATQVAPYLGAALDIALTAANSKEPAVQQAANAIIDVVGAALAAETGGLSMVAAPVVKADVGRSLQDVQSGNAAKIIALDANPAALPITIGLDIASMFGANDLLGGLFGDKGPRAKVNLPGLTETLNQTPGGAKTTEKSYNEGLQGAASFTTQLGSVTDLPSLVGVMNSAQTAHPGQFRINATTSAGEGVSNVTGGNYSRGFTASDLSDPAVLRSLKVYAGVLGAPAEQDQLTQALKQAIQAFSRAPAKPAVSAPPTAAEVSAKLPPPPSASVTPSAGGGAIAGQELIAQ